ncbi:uncharacterized protein [Halyomorpha halys]|uniref:uncharacterized protein n=1 Tax=Halyomorpha halys TaxID=286706 RepID=UPI0006D51031|nr:uncharacterized protein LOC106681280 [Halyomorpha halys]
MVRPTLFLICALTIVCGFPSGRFVRIKQSEVPADHVKKARAMFQMFTDNPYEAELLTKNFLSTVKPTSSEEVIDEHTASQYFLDVMQSIIPHRIMLQEFEGMKKRAQGMETPLRNGEYIEYYLRSYRTMRGRSPFAAEVRRMMFSQEEDFEDVPSSGKRMKNFLIRAIGQEALCLMLYYAMVYV